MTHKHRIFVSSVQKELEAERLAVLSLVTTDPFLQEHCEPVLFDREPLTGRKAARPYLDCLDTCGIYLLLINREYGRSQGSLSATHQEYHHAQRLRLPTLVFVKGSDDDLREAKTREFLDEVKKDGYTYRRFIDRLDLRTEVRSSLLKLLKDGYGVAPTAVEDRTGAETLEAASSFESRQTDASLRELNVALAREWLESAGYPDADSLSAEALANRLRVRGFLWQHQETGGSLALAAGVVFFGKNPSERFPNCRILLDAYQGSEIDPRPRDQETLSAPAPVAIDRILAFVKRNTRHPPRVVGIRRVALDEYPEKAVREAVVNAIAHRDYEDASRQIMVEVFHDRIVVASPGYPPKPLTISRLRRGRYRPCSRNPVIAQAMAALALMEQRGSGLARMRAAMLDHGLDAPEIEVCDGYFQVVLPGPNDDLERLRVSEGAGFSAIPPSTEEKLNDRQRKMATMLAEGESLTSRQCQKQYKVTRPTVASDFSLLIQQGIARKIGEGRATRYVFDADRNR